MRYAVTALALLTCATACSQRAAPYRFRGPIVSSVKASQPPGVRTSGDTARETPHRSDRTLAMVDTRQRTSIDLEPAETGPEVDPDASPLAGTLRSMVGLRRPDDTPFTFALSALATIGATVDESIRKADGGPGLVSIADERGALATEYDPLLGDLVIFDDVEPGKDASAIGIVASVRDDGTVEFVYLARGVVRRGFLNLRHKSDKRDEKGRVLNTILRQKHGNGKKGRGDLAGQLFSRYVQLGGLTPR